ncbi:Integrator complex subunit 3 [Clydaea vesicula]|uniref:Integrator complex subunit 3 n=1 Tax=Clydaea vesicula TaxID=447962 RepID=A0AAD5XX69_9FUNG|nr:Integrator complex subunit 3 [Clydaea vesicula]
MDFRSEEVVNLYEDHNLTAPDDLENKLSKSYKNIKSCIASTGEGTGSLNFNIEKLKTEAQSNYEQTVFGLTYLIFRKKTTNLHHQKIWQTLSLINKDNFSCFVKVYLNILGSVRFEKFSAKVNLFLCFKSLMATNTNGVNEVFFLVLRQLAGSNSSEENISWLTWILTTIELNQVWFSNLDLKLQSLALYTLLRFSLDLTVQVNLRKRLVTATVNILRGKFFDISMVIGRDLIRLLIEATDTNIPDLVKLLNDIIQKPNELDVRFQSIYQILAVPTPSDFFRSRLTPDMELKLMFILAQSKIFNYSKNFLWFQKQFLFQKEDEQLYSDLIRYILYCFHPSNSQLADKEAVPRYLLCWRFFNTMKHPPHKNLILNSLFFDWYFFEPRNENLMGLEPGILLIERFLKDIPNVSNLLIQTLKYNFDRYSKYFDKTYLLDNLNKSMKILIDSGVIRSLNSIYNHRNLHQASKECLFELFSQFLIDKNTLQFPQLNSPSKLEETSGKFQQRQKMLSISDLVNNDSRENIYDFKFVESTIKEIEDFKFSSSKINNKFEELFNLVNKNEDNHQNTMLFAAFV